MRYKKVFNTYEEAVAWVGRARTYREGYYLGTGYNEGMIEVVTGNMRSVSSVTLSNVKGQVPAMWSASETLRERMGLDPPGRGTMARMGGSATSPAKAASSRANGRKYGGRPTAFDNPGTPHQDRIARTYTLSPEAIAMIKAKAGYNASAYIEQLIRQDAPPEACKKEE